MKKSFKIFTGILAAAMLFAQPVMADETEKYSGSTDSRIGVSYSSNPTPITTRGASVVRDITSTTTTTYVPSTNIGGANFAASRNIVTDNTSEGNFIKPISSNLQTIKLLLESDEKMLQQDTYKIDGDIKMGQYIYNIDTSDYDFHMHMVPSVSEYVSVLLQAQIKNPDNAYIKAITKLEDEEHIAEVLLEDSILHLKEPTDEWALFGEYDYTTLLSDITKLLTQEQIKLLLSNVSYLGASNNGAQHWIEVEIDNQKFKELMPHEIGAIESQMESIVDVAMNDPNITEEELAELLKALDDVENSTNAFMKYIYIIDAETLLIEKVQYHMQIWFIMESENKSFRIYITASGHLWFTEYGEEVTFPTI